MLAVRWAEGGLRAVLSPATEEDPPELTAITIPRAAWSTFNARRVNVSDCLVSPAETPREPSSSKSVQDLASVTGLDYRPRRKVWAVERWGDDVLASLEGVSLERWDQDGGLRFRMTTDGVGCQIVAEDGVVLTNVEPPWGPPETGYRRSPSIIERIDPDSPTVSSPLPVGRADRPHPLPPRVVARTELLAGPASAAATPSCSHLHPISRRASRSADTTSSTTSCGSAMPPTCSSRRAIDRPVKHTWLVRLEIQPVPRRRLRLRRSPKRRRLYPLEWSPAHDGHIMGGPGAFVDDERGASIIHSGWIHSPRGLQVGAAFVIRRSYPDGALLWDQRQDSQAVGVACADGLVYVALISGELLAYDAATGALRHKSQLEVDGHPVAPLSLACFASRCVLVGTMDGRILKVMFDEHQHAGAPTTPAPATR